MSPEAKARRQLENEAEIKMAVVTYDFTTWTRYAPAFAALNPSLLCICSV
jgi:hypothetical protein